jgi:hypothetical protein
MQGIRERFLPEFTLSLAEGVEMTTRVTLHRSRSKHPDGTGIALLLFCDLCSRKFSAKKNFEFHNGSAEGTQGKVFKKTLFSLRALRLCGEYSSSSIGCGSAAPGSCG